jgi:hypothetical protein
MMPIIIPSYNITIDYILSTIMNNYNTQISFLI